MPPRAVTSGPAAADAASCTTRDLQAKLTNAQGAAGSVYQNIDFTNVGSTACSLYGYPGVSLGTGMPFKQIGAAASRSTTASPAVVTLSPGQTANALLRVTQALNYPSSTCSPKDTTLLRVYPPNNTAAEFVPLSGDVQGCSAHVPNQTPLQIKPVVAGANAQ